ncbi:Glucan endo-1,3-beta-glucosidase 13 [Camellia lanceoleosa]|uniref:Glucan endo-1,3-beta-glucosidase 13 n=1 Tax=Camellia lanceoleosa TaxID=1840588 RepID=A0ACC0GXT3_9ERIC|nr:Glucan endo-1,3-beta-glucosidase 13 [Camellia lanceoleosa]
MAKLNLSPSLSLPLIFSLCYFFPVASSFSDTGSIGVNYGRIADNLPPPSQVVQLLKSQGLNQVKLYDSDPAVLTALAGSAISVTVALPNELLSTAAAGQSFTDTWVQTNIVPYHPSTQIESIAVGNEVFADPNNTTQFLVSAMKNVYFSLVKFNLDKSIKISSPIALSALQTSYPSSSGSFKPDLIEPAIRPMLNFLKKTGSYLMAMGFHTTPFDAQIDAVFAAMNALQYDDVKIVVSETGWPSKGDENEAGASEANAASYNGNLVRRVLTGGGTPLRPNEPLNIFLFGLFNEDQKPGPTSERNYGLFYPDEERVYDVPFTLEALNSGELTPVNRSRAPAVAPSPNSDVMVSLMGQTWCVANGEVGVEKLQVALDYACGQGGADCTPIQPDAPCYNPNTLEAHASYAFNSYYQKMERRGGTCDFGGAGYVITQSPKFGSCEFPTGY